MKSTYIISSLAITKVYELDQCIVTSYSLLGNCSECRNQHTAISILYGNSISNISHEISKRSNLTHTTVLQSTRDCTAHCIYKYSDMYVFTCNVHDRNNIVVLRIYLIFRYGYAIFLVSLNKSFLIRKLIFFLKYMNFIKCGNKPSKPEFRFYRKLWLFSVLIPFTCYYITYSL